MLRFGAVVLAATALALVVSPPAFGDSAAIQAKQAEAQHVLGEINSLDANLEKAIEAYDASTQKLHKIESSLQVNLHELGVAKENLHRSQRIVAQRLVTLYTTGDSVSNLGVLLGAGNISDLVNRADTANLVAGQDAQVQRQVITWPAEECKRGEPHVVLNQHVEYAVPDLYQVVLRMKDDNDSAEPAASSVAALNLFRLSQIRNDQPMSERARKTIAAFATTLSHFPSAMPQLLVALDYSLGKPLQIVIAGRKDAPETKALLNEVHRHFLPQTILLLADGGEGQKYLGEKNEAIRAMSLVDSKPAAYVCRSFTCKAPVTEPKALAELISK